MSEIIEEMAQSVVREPEAMNSHEVASLAVALAAAAWNAVDDLSKITAGPEVWSQLRSTDVQRLMGDLVRMKRTRYGSDRRVIVSATFTTKRIVLVYWSLPADDLPHPIADAVADRVDRGRRGKYAHVVEMLKKTIDNNPFEVSLSREAASLFGAVALVTDVWEEIRDMREVAPIVELIEDANEEYLPSSPPMSPVTGSFFNTWGLLDAAYGSSRETIAAIVANLGREFGMEPETATLIAQLRHSRASVYVQDSGPGKIVSLRELHTGIELVAECPAGYRGSLGELWYARVVSPAPDGRRNVVLTTPYILRAPGEAEWLAYFERNLPPPPEHDPHLYFRTLMKQGPSSCHWLEFVFQAYSNYEHGAVFLAGLPDVPESMPHSEVNEARIWEP